MYAATGQIDMEKARRELEYAAGLRERSSVFKAVLVLGAIGAAIWVVSR